MRWIMSNTVNIPANFDFSLFHRGAETTPWKRVWSGSKPGREALGLTIEQETLQCLLYIQLRIQSNQPEADGKCIIGRAGLQESTYLVQSYIMCFLSLMWG